MSTAMHWLNYTLWDKGFNLIVSVCACVFFSLYLKAHINFQAFHNGPMKEDPKGKEVGFVP